MNISPLIGQAFTTAKGFGLAVDVTFTHITSTHTPSTGVMSAPVTTTVVGIASREEGDPKVYADLGLTELEPVTLLFRPTTDGQQPALGATVLWESRTRTVKNVSPTAPGGSAFVCRVIVA